MNSVKKVLIAFFLAIFQLFGFFGVTHASNLPTVTIINPIRGNELGHEHEDLLPGLTAQYFVTQKVGLHATWLWQYSALENQSLINFAKAHMRNEEFGIFLEIDRNFTNKSGVQYRGRGPWYFADGLLLASYDVGERRRLIDTVFSKFRSTFGYYPKTVGAWWIGADALSYMQEKYSITSAMKAADQYGIDAYTIWGSPWGIPYVASKENESIPAQSIANSSRVVIMQWAARDPLQAYGSTLHNGLYSIQDYGTMGYNVSYFSYLVSLYLHHPLDQVIIGLENSDPSFFSDTSQYSQKIKTISQMQRDGKIQISQAKEYAKTFLESGIPVTPHSILQKDYITDDQAFWYISPQYQLSIQKRNNDLFLVDVRNYAEKSPEAFSLLPNSQGNLLVNTPAIIDSATFPQQKRFLGKIDSLMEVKKENHEDVLLSGKKIIGQFDSTSAKIFGENGESFVFGNSMKPFVVFDVLFLFFAVYIVAFLATIHTKRALLQSFILGFSLVIAYPFLQVNPYIFDKKELLLSYFFIPFASLSTKIFLMQSIPFLLLVITHIVSIRTKSHWIFYIYAIFLCTLFLHFPYFPLDRSTYKIIGFIGSIIFLISLLLIATVAKMRKSKKIMLFGLLGLIVLLLIAFPTLLVSRSREALNSFEMNALQVVAKQKKPVMYLLPKDVPIYKAVRPILFDDIHFAGRLTFTKWVIAQRDDKNNLQLSNGNYVVVVPHYLGSTLYPEEATTNHLQKIFDNMEIAVYKKRR